MTDKSVTKLVTNFEISDRFSDRFYKQGKEIDLINRSLILKLVTALGIDFINTVKVIDLVNWSLNWSLIPILVTNYINKVKVVDLINQSLNANLVTGFII